MTREYIEKIDSLNDGREKLNKSIDRAYDADEKSDQSVTTSNKAETTAQNAEDKADSIQQQFNQVVIEGDSSVEAAQARVDEKGEPHATLKERIDDGFEKTTTQLAQTEMGVNVLENDVIDEDWTPAVCHAIEKMKQQGLNKVRFPANSNIKFNSTLVINADNFVLEGEGSIVDAKSLTKAISIVGDSLNSKIITEDITIGSRIIHLENVNDLKKGDFIWISSNEDFNIQRPGQFPKSEFNHIKNINTTDNTIEVITPLVDEYKIQGYELKLEVVIPKENITINNLTIEMDRANQNSEGIYIEWFKNLNLNNVKVLNAAYSSLLVKRGMGVIVDKCNVQGSNHSTLGYGVYFHTVQRGIIKDSYGENCRHSFEVGGMSRFIKIYNCHAENDISHGFSTHGGTEFITMDNNTARACRGGFVSRGKSATITQNNSIDSLSESFIIGESSESRDGEAGKNLIMKYNRAIRGQGIDYSFPTKLYNGDIVNNLSLENKSSNYCFNFRSAGIENSVIYKNKALQSDSIGFGFSITPNNSNNKFKNVDICGNKSINNSLSGMRFEGLLNEDSVSENVKIYGNNINDNGERGLEIQRGYFKNLEVYDNNLSGNNHADWFFGGDLISNIKAHGNIGSIGLLETTTVRNTDESGRINLTLYPSKQKPSIQLTVEDRRTVYIDSWTIENGFYTKCLIILETIEGGGSVSGRSVHIKIDY